MSAVTRPRGPLPARVYWTRRLLLVVLALALVYAVAHLLGAGGGSPDPSARPVGADGSTGTSSAPSPTTLRTTSPRTPAATPTRAASTSDAPLAVPTGPCTSEDVVAAPAAQAPSYGGRPVTLTVTLTTTVSPACTWEVSSESLVVKVAQGDERIWSSQDCEDAVPEESVVVRRDTPVTVAIAWSGRRSDADCSSVPKWALEGSYEVVAAALGGNPTQGQFELALPPRATETVTPTVTPSADASGSASRSASGSPSE